MRLRSFLWFNDRLQGSKIRWLVNFVYFWGQCHPEISKFWKWISVGIQIRFRRRFDRAPVIVQPMKGWKKGPYKPAVSSKCRLHSFLQPGILLRSVIGLIWECEAVLQSLVPNTGALPGVIRRQYVINNHLSRISHCTVSRTMSTSQVIIDISIFILIFLYKCQK